MSREPLVLAAALLAALAAGPGPVRAGGAPRPFAIAAATGDAWAAVDALGPLAARLAAELGRYGYDEGQVRVVGSVADLEQALRSGEADLAVADAAVAAALVARGAGQALGVVGPEPRTERGLLVVREGAGGAGLVALRDALVATSGPLRGAGFLDPRRRLAAAGLEPALLGSPGAPLAPGRTGFVFAGDPRTALDWLAEGRVAAAAITDLELAATGRAGDPSLELLDAGEPLPRLVAVAGPGLVPGVRDLLASSLASDATSAPGALAPGALDRLAGLAAAAAADPELAEAGW